MSDNTTTTRLSRAQLESLRDGQAPWHLYVQATQDALAYMTALEKLRNIDPNNWSVIEDLIEWVAGEVNEVMP